MPVPLRRGYARARAALELGGTILLAILHAALREIDRRTHGTTRAVAVFLGGSFLFVLAGTLAFAALASEVLEGETQRFDDAALRWIDAHATAWLDSVALEVTALGAAPVLAMVVLVASALLWVTGHRYSVLLLGVAMAGSIALTLALKLVFDRPRPTLLEWRVHHEVATPSFPSGHAMGSVVAYVTVAYLVARLQATRRMRRLTLAAAAVVVTLIGLSRLYLGVHYLSDVIAGYAIGLAWASLCALGIEALRYFREGRIWVQGEGTEIGGRRAPGVGHGEKVDRPDRAESEEA